MYGDTSVIRGLARSLRDQAADIRAEADRLLGQADHTPWTGLAADAMRLRARDRAAALRRTAGLHDDAAQALDRHADAVGRLKELIASIERRVHQLVDAARDRLASLAGGLLGVVPDPLDDFLDRFVPPPHGSRDWLDLDLPGVAR
jgi:hypothetical protein